MEETKKTGPSKWAWSKLIWNHGVRRSMPRTWRDQHGAPCTNIMSCLVFLWDFRSYNGMGLWFLCLSLGSFPSVGLYCLNLMLQFFFYFTILYLNVNLSTKVKDNHGSVHYTYWAKKKKVTLSME